MRMSRRACIVGSTGNWQGEYEEYDYIEQGQSSVMNRIKTSVKSVGIRAVFDLYLDSYYSSSSKPYAPILVRSGLNDNGYKFAYGLHKHTGSSLQIYGPYWNSRESVGINQWCSIVLTVTEDGITVERNGSTLLTNSNQLSLTDIPTEGWTLFGLPVLTGDLSPALNASYSLKGRFKRVAMYDPDSGALIGDLRPSMRKSDNQVGMYDLVNQEFYIPIDQYDSPATGFTLGNQ